MSTKLHWEKIYTEKSPQEVSWTQETPLTSTSSIPETISISTFIENII